MKKFTLSILFTVCILFVSYAQDIPAVPADLPVGGSDLANIDPEAMARDSISSLKASFGLTKIGDQTFAGFRFQPDFSFGKVGFGLDVPVQINIDTKEFRTDEFKGGIEMIRMIRYFSFGNKKVDGVYIKAGDLTGATLGYGTLVNNYTNSPSFEDRKWGINIDLNYKGFIGVEALYSDIKGFNLFGVRPYVRPLRLTSIPILKTLEFGGSFVKDKGANADSTGVFLEQDGMQATAYDAGITFLNSKFIKLVGYGQMSTLNRVESDTLDLALTAGNLTYNKGKGSSAGLSAKMRVTQAFTLDARIERLWYQDNYLPQFFDAIYEINKDAKILSLASATEQKGIYGNLAIILFNKFRINGGLLMPDNISVETPALVQVGIQATKLGNFTISGSYVKGNLENLKDAFTLDQRSLLNANVSYQLMSFLYVGMDYKWTFARMEDGSIEATDYFRPYFGLSFPIGGGGKAPKIPKE